MFEFAYNSGTNGDGVKMFKCGQAMRVPRMQPQPKIKDFRPGTPIYPVPIGFNAFLFGEGRVQYSYVRDVHPMKF